VLVHVVGIGRGVCVRKAETAWIGEERVRVIARIAAPSAMGGRPVRLFKLTRMKRPLAACAEGHQVERMCAGVQVDGAHELRAGRLADPDVAVVAARGIEVPNSSLESALRTMRISFPIKEAPAALPTYGEHVRRRAGDERPSPRGRFK
jgi:hypothetical protein